MTIHVHDLMPMFVATGSPDGTVVRYEEIWQRKNVLLVSLSENDPTSDAYRTSLSGLERDLAEYDAVLVVTKTRIEGVPIPGVVVADRWGEVYYVQGAGRAAGLPAPDELREWLQYVRNECPECEGETR
jgi:hypothetical protein